MKLDRLLGIVILLLNRERVSAKELAGRFGVTLRTIYRDLEAIDAAGIPIIARGGPGGGYGIDPDYCIDRSLVGSEEISAMLGALKGVNAAIGDTSLEKAMEKLGGLLRRGNAAPEEHVVVDLFPWGKRREERALARQVEAAISERRVLRFVYASYGREPEERTVEPMTLVFKSYAWYLWGWCRLRGDFRLFKLSRMRSLRTSLEHFKRRPGSYSPTLPAATGRPLTIKLRFDAGRAAEVEEWFPSDDMRLLEDGRLEVLMRVPEGDWIINTLLGFGPGMEVLEPTGLRDRLAAAAEKIAEKHAHPENR
jgi:predicted DNA-binding transcriptional regulator YafY